MCNIHNCWQWQHNCSAFQCEGFLKQWGSVHQDSIFWCQFGLMEMTGWGSANDGSRLFQWPSVEALNLSSLSSKKKRCGEGFACNFMPILWSEKTEAFSWPIHFFFPKPLDQGTVQPATQGSRGRWLAVWYAALRTAQFPEASCISTSENQAVPYPACHRACWYKPWWFSGVGKALLVGAPACVLKLPPMVQNAAARLALNQMRRAHVYAAAPLMELHWRPEAACIRSKPLPLTYRLLAGAAASYWIIL